MWRQIDQIVMGTAHVERGQITWRGPLRAAIVTTLVTVMAVAVADDALAIPLALGALFAGISDMVEAPAQRLRSMLWTTGWISVGGLIGGLLSERQNFELVVIAVVGAICGFAGALGKLGTLVGLLSLVMTTIASGVPESKVSAIEFGALVLLGGLIQTAVTVGRDLIVDRKALFERPPAKPPVRERLREHWNSQDPIFRHMIRLAVAMPFATMLAHLTGWPHSYWIPMTVAWLSKPNKEGFGSRILARLAGTLLGIGASVLVIKVAHLHQFGLALLVGVGSYLVVAFIAANYAIAVAGITSLVMALFTLIGEPIGETAHYRIVSTFIGAAIVIIAPLIYPPPRQSSSNA